MHSPTSDVASSLSQSRSEGCNARSPPVDDDDDVSGTSHSMDSQTINPPLLSVEIQSQFAAFVAEQIRKYFATHVNTKHKLIDQGVLAPPW